MALTSGGVAPQLPLDALQQITNALYALVKVSTPAAGIYVQKAGDTMAGELTINNPQVALNLQTNAAGGYVGMALTNSNTGGRTYYVTSTDNSAGVGGGRFGVWDAIASSYRLLIDGSGNCSAYTAWTVISDASLKTDIVDHPRGLTDILRVQPRKYRFDDADGYGFVAQELQQVMPELVRPAMPKAGTDGEMLLGITETGLIGPLINAVKELTARIEALEQRLSSQDKK